MDRLKQKISNLLEKSITYPIYVLDASNCKRKISKVWIEHNDILIKIDEDINYLQFYSNFFQINLYDALKKNINNKIWID